jgi:hypothetical protein
MPNCICREVVEVDVMSPALGERVPVEVKVETTGQPKFVWFIGLKNSARN